MVREPVVAQQDLIALLLELQRARKNNPLRALSPMRERDHLDFSGAVFKPSARPKPAKISDKDRKTFAVFLFVSTVARWGTLCHQTDFLWSTGTNELR